MQERIYITDISIAIEISKAMKHEYYIWRVNEFGEIYEILSSPKELAYICKAQCGQNSIRTMDSEIIFFNKEILMRMSIFNELPQTKIVYSRDVLLAEDYPDNMIGVNSFTQLDPAVHSIPFDIIRKMITLESYTMSLLNSIPIDYGEISNYPAIQQLLTINVSAGLLTFNPDHNHTMGIYKGMLSLNKSDKIYLKIYDNSIYNIFLSEFIITKKKNIRLCYYINFLNLNR